MTIQESSSTDYEATRIKGSRNPAIGTKVVHRRYVRVSDVHYGGGLVDGAYVMALFGDVATELSIICDEDEGLLAGYNEVRFLQPVRAGDVLEITGELTRVGTRSRDVAFTATIVCRATPDVSDSASHQISKPIIASTAKGTVVVARRREHLGGG